VAVQDRITARTVYLYVVCLITLLVCLFAAVQLVRSSVEIFYPDADSSSFGWSAYTPLDAEFDGAEYFSQGQLSEVQRRTAIHDTIAAGTTLLLAGGVHLLHWRRAQRERSVAVPVVPAGPSAP
jgi:hypothetical protein